MPARLWRYLASKQLSAPPYTSGHAAEMFNLLDCAESRQVF
jgi:hypothetical protein